jgi:hypothetical protein
VCVKERERVREKESESERKRNELSENNLKIQERNIKDLL